MYNLPPAPHRAPRMSWGCQGHQGSQANSREAWGAHRVLVPGGVGPCMPPSSPDSLLWDCSLCPLPDQLPPPPDFVSFLWRKLAFLLAKRPS